MGGTCRVIAYFVLDGGEVNAYDEEWGCCRGENVG